MTTIYVKEKPTQERDTFDFYPTPLHVADTLLCHMPHRFFHMNILDAGAGTGVFGRAAKTRWPSSTLTGVELRPVLKPTPYTFWLNENFLLLRPEPVYDAFIGNPPYKYAEEFIRLGMKFLSDNGVMGLLLRLSFLESVTRYKGLWRTYPPYKVVVCSERVSYTGDGKSNATAYAFYYWVKGRLVEETALHWTMFNNSFPKGQNDDHLRR